jgi:hypothetical protein
MYLLTNGKDTLECDARGLLRPPDEVSDLFGA